MKKIWIQILLEVVYTIIFSSKIISLIITTHHYHFLNIFFSVLAGISKVDSVMLIDSIPAVSGSSAAFSSCQFHAGQ
jgi:hypothetical protein